MFQLAPSLINVNDKYCTFINAVKLPSIVCDDVVFIVIIPVPTFLITYELVLLIAVGSVIVIVFDAKYI